MKRLALGVLLALVSSSAAAAFPPSTWSPPDSAFIAVEAGAPTGSTDRGWSRPIQEVGPTKPPAPTPPAPPTASAQTTSCATVACARSYALNLLGPTQFGCLDSIFTRESHWNPLDLSHSGAYGIPQALPGSKMAWAGADWRTNAVTQVRWGLHYIAGRYGTACAAWAFWQVYRWY